MIQVTHFFVGGYFFFSSHPCIYIYDISVYIYIYIYIYYRLFIIIYIFNIQLFNIHIQ